MATKIRLLLLTTAVLAATACARHVVAPAPPAPAATAAKAATPASADLAAAAMPNAPGKTEVIRVCGGCHTLARVVRLRQSRQQWQATIQQMQDDNGLFASPAALASILNYLTQHYGPPQTP